MSPGRPGEAHGGSLESFIAGLPKAELHLHLVGAAPPAVVGDLAARHEGVTAVPADPELLAAYFAFRDFDRFVEVFLSVVDLIRDPDDLRRVADGVVADLLRQQVRYAEVTVTPVSHLRRGLAAADLAEVLSEASRAAARSGLELRWCCDIPSLLGPVAAEETLAFALNHRPDGLVSLGLGGPERGVDLEAFQPVFARARAAGLRSVPHAGETTGPATIWHALRGLGAERIGHGTSCLDDPELVDFLIREGIPLEVCVTSNLCTGAVGSLSEHPLPRMIEEGVLATVNSDDPTMFSTTLSREYRLAAELMGWGAGGLAQLARGAVHASFAEPASKSRLLAEVDAYLAAWRGGGEGT